MLPRTSRPTASTSSKRLRLALCASLFSAAIPAAGPACWKSTCSATSSFPCRDRVEPLSRPEQSGDACHDLVSTWALLCRESAHPRLRMTAGMWAALPTVPAYSGGFSMRTMLLATVLILLGGSSALAQKVGDRIVVTAAAAPLKLENDIVGTVPKGSILTVRELNRDWFWVIFSGAKGTTKGWIKRPDVIPFENALDFFNDELRRSPTAELSTIRGTIWDEKHEYDKAIADFDEAIRLDPQSSTAFRRRGHVWTDKQEYEKAIADFDEAVRLDPNDARGYFGRGRVWFEKKAPEKALADLTEAIRLDPLCPTTFLRRGRVWSDMAEYGKAIADCNEAIRLDPRQALAYSNRGYVWYSKGDYDRAIPDYSAALRLDPKDSWPLLRRGRASVMKKD